MLDKLLRAPLPEQVVALLEKLEQNPDASHLEKVEDLLGNHTVEITWYEEWCIRRVARKVRNVIRRERTLNKMMSIVINEPSDRERREEERAKMYMSMNGGPISGTLAQHAAAQQAQIAQINLHQQMMNQYGSQLRNTYLTGGSQ